MKIKVNLFFVILLAFAPPISAQRLPPADVTRDDPPEFKGEGRLSMTLPIFYTMFDNPPLAKNAPYSAEIIIETIRSPKGGAKNVKTAKYFVHRDGSGRIRRERDPLELHSPESNIYYDYLPQQLTIVDPVGGFNYDLFPSNKTFTRNPYYPSPQQIGLSPVTNRHSGLIAQPRGYSWCIESLGTQIIEGLQAQGSRATLSFTADGDQRIIGSVSEGWYSHELEIPLITKLIKPNGYEETIKVVNIKRGAPKKTLFVVPTDYKRVEIVVTGKAG